MRRHWLDNIRWAVVLLVLVYHVFYMFNAAGVFGGLGPFAPVQYQDALLYFVYPWFMVLLFTVAGMSAKYALDKTDGRSFFRSRTVKLLVPSTLGLFVFQWLVGYLNIRIGGGLESIPGFLLYPIMVLSGTGPLWFAQLLWLFSLLLLAVRRLDRGGRFCALCARCTLPVLLALALVIWGGAQVLNPPIITTYRFGIYFAAFLIGYFVLSHDEVIARLERARLPLLAAACLLGLVYTVTYFGQNYTEDACLKSLFTNVYAWLAVLAVLACGKAWFDRTGPFADYMTCSSYGIYIVHYLFVLAPCWLLKTYTALPVWLIYVLGLVCVLVLSPACYELLRRIPVLRYLVLGIKKQRPASAAE